MRTIPVLMLLSVLAALPAAAQTSLGFAEPQDVSALLGYRLPDWSYRTWDATVSLNGSGAVARTLGSSAEYNVFDSRLATKYSQSWESEQHDLSLGGELAGAYRRSHSQNTNYDYKSRNLGGDFRIWGDWKQYLGESQFSLVLSGDTSRKYQEDVRQSREGTDTYDDEYYQRSFAHQAAAGTGWGRVRNVVPLLQAQRLSERLAALGRPALTSGQIQVIAQVLAQESGYRAVFDRSDRRFWTEVLAPMLDARNPLTPYEIYFLTDVKREVFGDRYEGFDLRAQWHYSEFFSTEADYEPRSRQRGPQAEARWFHNPSLNRQLSLAALYRYRMTDQGSVKHDESFFYAKAGHFWNLADRYGLDTTLTYRTASYIGSDQRRQSVDLRNTFNVYLEDQVSLTAAANISHLWDRSRVGESFRWNWTYQLGLTYHLDRLFV